MSGFPNPVIPDIFQGQFPDREILKIPDFWEFKILSILAQTLLIFSHCSLIRILDYWNFVLNFDIALEALRFKKVFKNFFVGLPPTLQKLLNMVQVARKWSCAYNYKLVAGLQACSRTTSL